MMGYWKNSKLTAEVLKGGWYHTGDMGYVDEEGYIFMTDRKADMIISGGENVYPKEVEDVIYGHPAVKECTVVSSPDAKWGEVVQAVVVLHPGKQATQEEIIEHCKKNLAGYKCPKGVAFWNDIPKTVVGKIDLLICRMEPDVKLQIELTINKGRGYVPSEENKPVDAEFGLIPIDSIHTPIKNVKFAVENYRVEQKTDYEKLLLEITTDGSIQPKEALKEAAKILIYHFMLFSDEKIDRPRGS